MRLHWFNLLHLLVMLSFVSVGLTALHATSFHRLAVLTFVSLLFQVFIGRLTETDDEEGDDL